MEAEMELVRQTYVEFLYPGTLTNESSVSEVKTRNCSYVKVPRDAFGFLFFDILSVVVEDNGQKVELMSERTNLSSMYYYGGELHNLADIRLLFPEGCALLKKMENNGYTLAIKCRTGNWQIFEEHDILIKPFV